MIRRTTIWVILVLMTATTAWAVEAPVQATGQTSSSADQDDGALQLGVAWPEPRFTINDPDTTVTDNLTGLIWMRDANLPGALNWAAALSYLSSFSHAGHDDWRLPTVRELDSLVDLGRSAPALPADHPFLNVQQDGTVDVAYWSSTAWISTNAWTVNFDKGTSFSALKTDTRFVWPVRGGHVAETAITGRPDTAQPDVQELVQIYHPD